MDQAKEYLSQVTLPEGPCPCIYKGRSRHCTCFRIINPSVPEYSVHDIARIGSSWKKLAEMIDSEILEIHQVPPHIKLSPIQQNQVNAYKLNKTTVDKEALARELNSLKFPLYFIDYETLPAAVPKFNSFAPYDHIPFQYSLYVLESSDSEPKLLEFIHAESDDPSNYFVDSLKMHIGKEGSIIVWHKSFECGRNTELAERIPEMQDFIDNVNGRIYDLEEIFKKQYYVHKDFRGSTSIKQVSPFFAPELSYKDLEIQDGGAAAEMWSRIHLENTTAAEKEKIINALKIYCGRDAYEMYAIWKEIYKLIQ